MDKDAIMYGIENELLPGFFYANPQAFLITLGKKKEEGLINLFNNVGKDNGWKNPFSKKDLKVQTFQKDNKMIFKLSYLNVPNSVMHVLNKENYFIYSLDERKGILFAVELPSQSEIGALENMYGKDSKEVENTKSSVFLCVVTGVDRLNLGCYPKEMDMLPIALKAFDDLEIK